MAHRYGVGIGRPVPAASARGAVTVVAAGRSGDNSGEPIVTLTRVIVVIYDIRNQIRVD